MTAVSLDDVSNHSASFASCQYVNTSLFAIFTNQYLQTSQNQMASGVTPDPFFCHHKEKQKKAVWPCKTTCLL